LWYNILGNNYYTSKLVSNQAGGNFVVNQRGYDNLTHEIKIVVDWVVEELHPQCIYLYNKRENHKGQVTAFKLCVIAEIDDKPAAERAIYLGIDSEVPFDILLYTPPEWEELTRRDASFAGKIIEMGMIVYA
jgi:hypothetical protein